MKDDKRCNFFIYKNIGEGLFSKLYIRINEKEKVSISSIKQERKADIAELPAAIERIKKAKEDGGSVFYHNQLTKEYINGFSLQDLAKGLGLNSAAPLYYGVQRSLSRASRV